MTLLFGQHPQGGMADRQIVTHGMVGSIGDLTPSQRLSPMSGGGGGARTYFRRNTITAVAPELDDDVIAALTVFTILENDTP